MHAKLFVARAERICLSSIYKHKDKEESKAEKWFSIPLEKNNTMNAFNAIAEPN